MAPPPWHRHVTEREPDGSWEDCLPASAVMHARAAHDRTIPATHAEAEALRVDAGLPPTGGVTIEQIIPGLQRRYGWAGGRLVGSADLLDALRPGTSAIVSGRLAHFEGGHRLRRWQPTFSGGHSVWIARLRDGTLWWDDPLGPATSYSGEAVTEAELRTFTRDWPGRHLVAPILEADMFAIVTRTPFPAPVAWRVAAGATVSGYDPGRPGSPVKSVRFDRPSMAHAIARVGVEWRGLPREQWPVPRGAPFLEVVDGLFAGLLIVERSVTLDPIPDAAALARGRALEEARSAAVDAVGRAIDALLR